jgi:hypothetical protein
MARAATGRALVRGVRYVPLATPGMHSSPSARAMRPSHPRPHAGRCRHQRRAFLSDHAEPLLDLCQRIRPELTCLGDRGLPLLDVMTLIERLARTVESGRYQSGSPG